MQNNSNFTKINLPIFQDLDKELLDLIDNKIISWGEFNQICINTTVAEADNYLFGCSSLTYNWSAAVDTSITGLTTTIVPKKTTQVQESDFTEFCTQFSGTSFEKIYNILTSTYKVGRIRLMKLEPRRCLSWHTDSSKRLHYPIITQEGCYMVIENEACHLEKNFWIMTNTEKMHTAFNGSNRSRIHIVAAIL
jgi:hypothetical protein